MTHTHPTTLDSQGGRRPSRRAIATLAVLPIVAALVLLAGLMGCGPGEIGTVPGAPNREAGAAGTSQGPQPGPDFVDVEGSITAQREPSHQARPASKDAVQTEPDPDGPKLTIRIEASRSTDPMVSVYLLDRKADTHKAFKEAKSAAPFGAWDPVLRFGKFVAESPLLQSQLTLEIPLPPRRSYICARAGDKFGMAIVKSVKHGPLVIKLNTRASDGELVQVVHDSGKPAIGVKVRGATLTEDGRPKNANFGTSYITGPNGVAMAYMRPGEEDFIAEVIGIDPVRTTGVGEGWRIELPPMGTARFSFPPGSKDAEVRLFGKQKWNPLRKSEDDGAGPIVFHGIPTGLPLTYKASVHGANAAGDVPPISQDGEMVELIPELNHLRRITMQLMRGEMPVANGCKVVVTLRTPATKPGGYAWSKDFIGEPTDAEGRSSVLIDESEMALADVDHCEILTLPTKPRLTSPAQAFPTIPLGHGARAGLDAATLVTGPLDLGIINMGPLPLTAAGIVLDPNDQPVAGASVSIRKVIAEDPDPESILGVGGGRMGGRISVDPKQSVRADQAMTRTNAEGRFELRGRGDPTVGGLFNLHARVVKRGYSVSEGVPFEPGATNIVVRLRRGGLMRIDPGKLDQSMAGRAFGYLTHQPSGKERQFGLSRPTSIKNLVPGTYTLVARIGRFEVLTIDDLVVSEGGECADPRLNLGLARFIQKRRLRVLGLHDSASVTLTLTEDPSKANDPGKGGEDRKIKTSDGWIEFACPSTEAPRQVIDVTGRIPIEVTHLPNGSQVTLEPLLKVTIRFEGARPPGAGTQIIVVSANPIHRMARGSEDPVVVGQDGTATALVPGPGEYKCIVMGSDRSKESPWSAGPLTVDGPVATLQADAQTTR